MMKRNVVAGKMMRIIALKYSRVTFPMNSMGLSPQDQYVRGPVEWGDERDKNQSKYKSKFGKRV